MTAETINLDELLPLIGYSTDTTRGCMEYVSLCQQAEGTPFGSTVGVWFGTPEKAANLTQRAGLNLWFGVNALRSVERGRGKADDVTRLAALIADLDIKKGGCPDLETAFAIITAMSKVLGQEPVVVTHSGHGLQPYWAVEVESGRALLAGSNDQAKRLGKRFHALLDKIAADHGCGVDSTFDLPRVLRVPGSVNYKDPENPVPVRCFATGGKPLTVEQITAALDAAGIPEEPKTRGSSKKQQPRGVCVLRGKSASYRRVILRSIISEPTSTGMAASKRGAAGRRCHDGGHSATLALISAGVSLLLKGGR